MRTRSRSKREASGDRTRSWKKNRVRATLFVIFFPLFSLVFDSRSNEHLTRSFRRERPFRRFAREEIDTEIDQGRKRSFSREKLATFRYVPLCLRFETRDRRSNRPVEEARGRSRGSLPA